MNQRVKWLGVLSLLVFLFSFNANLAKAETPGLKAKKVEASIRPEYDDPRTLVVIQGELVNVGKDTLPKGTPISFVIPKGSQINMACELTGPTFENHECQPFTTKDLENNKVEISWKTTKDLAPNQAYHAFLDVYYDNKATAPAKSFTYEFIPTYEIDDLSVSVTAPKAASDFKLEPSATSTAQDQDGLTNYFMSLKNKAPKDNIAIKVSYTKSDDKPTFAKQQTGAGQDQGVAPKLGNSSSITVSMIILIVVVLVFLVAMVIYVLRNPGNSLSSHNFKKVPKRNGSVPKPLSSNDEKKKLRKMLLDGKISEETYKELVADLED